MYNITYAHPNVQNGKDRTRHDKRASCKHHREREEPGVSRLRANLRGHRERLRARRGVVRPSPFHRSLPALGRPGRPTRAEGKGRDRGQRRQELFCRVAVAGLPDLPQGQGHRHVPHLDAVPAPLLLLLQPEPGGLRALPSPRPRRGRRAGRPPPARHAVPRPSPDGRRAAAAQTGNPRVLRARRRAVSERAHAPLHERNRLGRNAARRPARRRAARDSLQREG